VLGLDRHNVPNMSKAPELAEPNQREIGQRDEHESRSCQTNHPDRVTTSQVTALTLGFRTRQGFVAQVQVERAFVVLVAARIQQAGVDEADGGRLEELAAQ
jgi:hypothetical protein